MVERYRRARGKKKLLGNHQKCWIWGRNCVRETLRAGVWTIHDLWLSTELTPDEIDAAQNQAKQLSIETHVVSTDTLRGKCHSSENQGYVARMAPFPYADIDTLQNCAEQTTPLIVVCDRIQDPFNFGAIIRSAEVLGATAVVVGQSHQVGVTSLVARSSAGAVNHIPIARTNLVSFLSGRRQDGFAIVGLDAQADRLAFSTNLTGPLVLIVGNEGAGVANDLRSLCTDFVQIPQAGQLDSLNAAVSASILFYEAGRQRLADG